MEENTHSAILTLETSADFCGPAALKSPTEAGPQQEACGVTLRGPVPADSLKLLKMHQRLSRDSIYFRYLRHYMPALAEMQAICSLPSEQGQAFVAELPDDGRSIIGLAYYIRDAERDYRAAEFGIAVEDGFQGISLGRVMFDHMCDQALRNGVDRLEAYVHPQNKRMIGLLKHYRRPVAMTLSTGHLEVAVDLSP